MIDIHTHIIPNVDDGSSNEFLQKLFELEVPEIFDGLITIKNWKYVSTMNLNTGIRNGTNNKNIDELSQMAHNGWLTS